MEFGVFLAFPLEMELSFWMVFFLAFPLDLEFDSYNFSKDLLSNG
jgi:hypothetical protein